MATSDINRSADVECAEDWVTAVNDIIRKYRGTSPTSRQRRIGLNEAVSRMRSLGLSEGDAIRWLEPRRKTSEERRVA